MGGPGPSNAIRSHSIATWTRGGWGVVGKSLAGHVTKGYIISKMSIFERGGGSKLDKIWST
jgi:hypothetical protein